MVAMLVRREPVSHQVHFGYREMILREVAHSRTGDKGRIPTVSLIAYRDADYPLLEERVTAEKVGRYFGGPCGVNLGCAFGLRLEPESAL
jgi:hypothetical protein